MNITFKVKNKKTGKKIRTTLFDTLKQAKNFDDFDWDNMTFLVKEKDQQEIWTEEIITQQPQMADTHIARNEWKVKKVSGMLNVKLQGKNSNIGIDEL